VGALHFLGAEIDVSDAVRPRAFAIVLQSALSLAALAGGVLPPKSALLPD
jgi:hypothetical protein